MRRTVARLASVAGDQWGLITRQQAEAAGVSRATMARLAADGSVVERVARGVFRLAGAPEPRHQALKAAWLQLEPKVPAWAREPIQAVVSHRSAAALYDLGDLTADTHQFTVPDRRQSRRRDVRLHSRPLRRTDVQMTDGLLPVTRPGRIAYDLLADHEEPGAIATIIVDALRTGVDRPGAIAEAIAPWAARCGLGAHDGAALLAWLLELGGESRRWEWIEQAEAHRGESEQPRRRAWKDVRSGRFSAEASERFEQAERSFRIGQDLRWLREQRGMSQSELAQQIDEPTKLVARLEAGEFGPELAILQRVARALSVKLEIRLEASAGTKT